MNAIAGPPVAGAWPEATSAGFGTQWRLRDGVDAPEGTPDRVLISGVVAGSENADPASAGLARELVLIPVPFGTALSCCLAVFEQLYVPDTEPSTFTDDLDAQLAALAETAR